MSGSEEVDGQNNAHYQLHTDQETGKTIVFLTDQHSLKTMKAIKKNGGKVGEKGEKEMSRGRETEENREG